MKVVKIGAVWCPGCLVMRPRWQEIEEENPWLETVYYDFDNDKLHVNRYVEKDENLPVFIFEDKQGNELARVHGEVSKKDLMDLIKRFKDQ